MRALSDLPQSLLLLLVGASSSLALPRHHWNTNSQSVLGSTASDRRGGGAVASESKVCSQIGIDLLARGGNAVDAFIGTQLCVGVIGMYHSGLGGGGFALIRDENGGYTVIDYRESAPSSASEDMYRDNVPGSIFGGLAAGVPGELRGLEFAHQKFGALSWYDVVYPSSLVARDGFLVTGDTVRYMDAGVRMAGWNFLVEDPSWAVDFAPGGTLLKVGDIMYRKRYAETLRKVAEHGADAFYTGEIAEATISIIQKSNGTMTLADLAAYKAITREAVNITYRGYKIYSPGSPTSGAVSLSTLKIMEGYSTSDTADKNLTLHRFVEAMRFGYGARQELGDPAYIKDASRLDKHMLSASNANTLRTQILDNTTQPVENYAPKRTYTTPGHGTSHISTADSSGMAVSSTTTINLLFGNLQMVPSTGVILNNEMNDFSIPGIRNEFGFEPAEANFIRGGKRPLSSITPLIITRIRTHQNDDKNSNTGTVEEEEEDLFAVLGAAGGSRIISATTQVAWHVLEHNQTMTQATRQPRVHDQLIPNNAVLEAGFDEEVAASLREKGHNITWVSLAASAVQGVRVSEGGVFEAAGESRQGGSAGLTL
ncbi:gamma-glutamyltranspeptidase [Xylaria arbuscula]|nr:gamma-glutamyltranspeptidase [Xylaria arbuscula]